MADANVNDLLREVQDRLVEILGPKLIGLYLGGSRASGSADDSSDIDLLVVLRSELDARERQAIEQFHAGLVKRFTCAGDRPDFVEAIYVTATALAHFRTHPCRLLVASGGTVERVESSLDWTMNWYDAQERSLPLLGPPARSLFDPPITQDEFLAAVRHHVRQWRHYVNDATTPHALAYAVLTVARGLSTIEHRRQVSKHEASAWAQRTYPQWAALIRRTSEIRAKSDPSAVVQHDLRDATVAFIDFAIGTLMP